MPTLITNTSPDHIALPYPMRGLLAPGESCAVNVVTATLLTLLAGTGVLKGLALTEVAAQPSYDTFRTGTADDSVFSVPGALTAVGDFLASAAFKMVLADAGAAAASGTASAHAGTFTVASGQTGYVLTNTKITANSLLFCCCISGAVAQEVRSFIPTANTGTLLLSGAAGANAKYAFLVITPSA